MAQSDIQSNHIVVDIIDGAGPSSCAVCTEALEWTAVGPCGHGDVCAHCTARLRFLEGHRRCCICRTGCPTVLVTTASGGAARPQPFSRPPPARGREGRVGRHYWYLADMAAYFDDQRQYEAMRKVCVKPPCSTSTSATTQGVAMNQSAARSTLQPARVGADSDADPDECQRLERDFICYYFDVDHNVGTVLSNIREVL
ncbi:hypothetical protein ACP4OV_023741 [Aristida adscensionis]